MNLQLYSQSGNTHSCILALLFGKCDNNFIILYVFIMEDSFLDSFAVPDLYLILLVLFVTVGKQIIFVFDIVLCCVAVN